MVTVTAAGRGVLLNVVLVAHLGLVAVPVQAVTFCNDIKTCGECVSAPSWVGSCRWCPLDRECHAFASVATNDCSAAEDVVSTNKCDDVVADYSPDLSWTMLRLSSAAYSLTRDGLNKCLANLMPEAEVSVANFVQMECGKITKQQCSGYVGVSHVHEAIIVAFRGSIDFGQVLDQLSALVIPKQSFSDPDSDAAVQAPFLEAFERLWPLMDASVKDLVSRYGSYRVWVTGHSLGGALASLVSTWIVHANITQQRKVFSYTFGMPRVGDYDYAVLHDRLVNNSFRVVNANDVVTHLPGILVNNMLAGPYHHGVEVYYRLPLGAITPGSNYKVCRGLPNHEDVTCGLTSLLPSLDRHVKYFGIKVGDYCEQLK